MNTAILLFVYNRPIHTEKVVDSLLSNSSSGDYDLLIFSDGAKDGSQNNHVFKVRDYISTITGFKTIRIFESEQNLGLSKSILGGIQCAFESYDSVIIIEDDILVSPYFLNFISSGLALYESNEDVISIHGYTYPTNHTLPETFFMRGADCWGWATWKKDWSLFNPDGLSLLKKLIENRQVHQFDHNGTSNHSKILREQVSGKQDSWAIRWHASAFLANKLTLYPGRSLVQNIGNDGSGRHCGNYDSHWVELSDRPISVDRIDVAESQLGALAFEEFYRKSKETFFKKILRRISFLLHKWQ